jgi:hypothetical protein
MLDDAPDPTADRVALALAQVFDLLGNVLAIKPIVRRGRGSQHLGLVLRPGVRIVFVARSVRHRHRLILGACHGAGDPAAEVQPRQSQQHTKPLSWRRW